MRQIRKYRRQINVAIGDVKSDLAMSGKLGKVNLQSLARQLMNGNCVGAKGINDDEIVQRGAGADGEPAVP